MAEVKRDYTPVIIAGAAGMVGFGAWLMFRPKGAKAGDFIEATFEFDYYGNGGMYILQISLGKIWPFDIFDHIDGMTWESNIEIPAAEVGGEHFVEVIEFQLPEAAKAKTYDAEAGIRLPGSGQFEFLDNTEIKIKGALLVEERK